MQLVTIEAADHIFRGHDVIGGVVRLSWNIWPLRCAKPDGRELAMELSCDVLVVGGGCGGVAAALAASDLGRPGRVDRIQGSGWSPAHEPGRTTR